MTLPAQDIEGATLPHRTITYANAVERVGLSQKTLQRLAKAGEIRAWRWGRSVLLSWDDLDDIISKLPPAYPSASDKEAA